MVVDFNLTGQTVVLDTAEFSSPDGTIVEIPLSLFGFKGGFTGIRQDSLGRNRCYADGEMTKCPEEGGVPVESGSTGKVAFDERRADPTKAPKPTTFANVAESDVWGKQHFSNWKSELTPEEKWAVEAYSGGGYENINGYLREKHQEDMSDAPGKTKQVLTGLDAALEKGRAPEPMTVFRGVRGDVDDPEGLVKRLIKLAKDGGTLEDKAYMSSSLSQKIGKEFGRNTRKGVESAIMEINVPKGAKGAYTDVLDLTGEAEWLMPRGSKIKLTKAEQGDDGVWKIQAEVVQ